MLLTSLGRGRPALSRLGCRTIACTPVRLSLADFFEAPLKDGEERTAGRAWKAADLRQKSWDDLHTLWYVLLKERNLLQSEKLRFRAEGKQLPNPQRTAKVRKSMARIKAVLSERAKLEPSAQRQRELMNFINAL